MSTFILVILMFAGVDGGVAVEKIEGFKSYKDCLRAAANLNELELVARNSGYHTRRFVEAVCIEQERGTK